jgi:hypothetical protein
LCPLRNNHTPFWLLLGLLAPLKWVPVFSPTLDLTLLN